ncbi:MAG: VWA domain-containing protein [Symploca sp. SIO1A3]|nr:VWA domain-containing protein [Symploca sp. SIO1A3]
MLRRLPIYLLLDCSGSMTGDPIEAVRQGLKALLSDLRGDPMALETAYLSVITFDSSAHQVCPLTDLGAFQEPDIQASGTTSLGEALTLLEKCLDQEVQKSTPEQKGDWKPLVFLMTDGMPTDSWENAADQIKQKKPANIIACAAGPQADESLLKRMTDIVVKLDNLQPDALKAFFKWVSDSIKTTSQSIGQQTTDNSPINLPPPPPHITIIP